MQQLLDIINVIATPRFMEKYEFLNNQANKVTGRARYIQYLTEWNLTSEIILVNNETTIIQKIANNNRLTRIFNQPIFKDDEYNVDRLNALKSLLN